VAVEDFAVPQEAGQELAAGDFARAALFVSRPSLLLVLRERASGRIHASTHPDFFVGFLLDTGNFLGNFKGRVNVPGKLCRICLRKRMHRR
jgi:hypothetical protein